MAAAAHGLVRGGMTFSAARAPAARSAPLGLRFLARASSSAGGASSSGTPPRCVLVLGGSGGPRPSHPRAAPCACHAPLHLILIESA